MLAHQVRINLSLHQLVRKSHTADPLDTTLLIAIQQVVLIMMGVFQTLLIPCQGIKVATEYLKHACLSTDMSHQKETYLKKYLVLSNAHQHCFCMT